MANFATEDRVETTRKIHAGSSEDGPFVCDKGEKGTVQEIDSSEWDGVHVMLDSGVFWWFKPGQLSKCD